MRILAFTVIALVASCRQSYRSGLFPPPCLALKSCNQPAVVADSNLPTGSIRGPVVARSAMCPLARALVRSAATRQRTFTTKRGEFTIEHLMPGVDTLIVGFIAYKEATVPLTIPSAGGLWLLVPMDMAATAVSDGFPCAAA